MRTIIIGIALATLTACSDSGPEMETAEAGGGEYIEDTVEPPEIPCRSDGPWAEYRIPQYEPKKQKSLAEEHYDDVAETALRQDALKREKAGVKQAAKPVAKPCPEMKTQIETPRPSISPDEIKSRAESMDEFSRSMKEQEMQRRIEALEMKADATQGQR